jgi:hypothetical protein
LHAKVAKDSALQAKFSQIMRDAEKAGEAATGKKLAAFAKEAGFDVTLEEMQDFFRKLAEGKGGELSDAELDAVAGGKSSDGWIDIGCSVVSLGTACVAGSAARTVADGIGRAIGSPAGNCGDFFK